MRYKRTIKKISLDAYTGDVVIQFRGHSQAIEAKALDFKRDEENGILYLLLDRLVHKEGETAFDFCQDGVGKNGFTVEGCFVSEFAVNTI